MQYISIATALAKEAGIVMRKHFTLGMRQTWKSDNSPVTIADKIISELVVSTLRTEFPDHHIVSEEGVNIRGKQRDDYTWICDPIDGTFNFSHGLPTASFALALLFRGYPVIAVIYDPFLDRMFVAEKGKGARLNGTRIHVASSRTLRRGVIGIGFGKKKTTRNLFPIVETLTACGALCVVGPSIHYIAALVAAGEFRAAFFGGTDPHDIAASVLVVTEAGGHATDLFGNTMQRYDRPALGQLYSNGSLHDTCLHILDETDHAVFQ